MKPEILHNDHMMFLDRALETQRTALLTAMADAVSECRTAADQAAELTETGETGLLRLVEILCAAKVQRGQAGETVLEGTEVQILADVVAQLYACLTECRFVGPLGLVLVVYYVRRRCPKCHKFTLRQESQRVLSVTQNYRLVEYTYVCSSCGAVVKRQAKNLRDDNFGGGAGGGMIIGGRGFGGFGGGSRGGGFGGGSCGGGGAGSRW